MVAIVILLSGIVGLVAAVLAGYLGAGFLAVMLIYAVVGNVTFAALTSLAMGKRAPTHKPDFAAEIEADLVALLDEREEALRVEAAARSAQRYPLLRPHVTAGEVPTRRTSLFRSR